MACTRPLNAWFKPGGGLAFKAIDGWTDRHLTIECGQCLSCRIAKQRGWAVRCANEAQLSKANCFLTLTYDEAHIPENRSLRKKDFQDFAKRARKKLGQFRYLHCGEYGAETQRPHYHAIVFGQDFHHDRVPVSKRGDHIVYLSATVAELWPHGTHELGSVTWDSAQYVARYTLKKVTGKKAEEAYRRITKHGEAVTVEPEYATMSNRPGIGHNWLIQYLSDVYPDDKVIINGNSYRPPKYYDQLLEKINPEMHERVIANRLKYRHKELRKSTYDLADLYRVKEKILDAKVGESSKENNLDYEGTGFERYFPKEI